MLGDKEMTPKGSARMWYDAQVSLLAALSGSLVFPQTHALHLVLQKAVPVTPEIDVNDSVGFTVFSYFFSILSLGKLQSGDEPSRSGANRCSISGEAGGHCESSWRELWGAHGALGQSRAGRRGCCPFLSP